MKLKSVEIENYRAIEKIDLQPDPQLTVLHGDNAHGKTSVLSAIAAGLGSIPMLLPGVSGVGFLKTDRRGSRTLRIALTATNGVAWDRRVFGQRRKTVRREFKEAINAIVNAGREESEPLDLPIVAFYDTDPAVLDQPRRRNGGIVAEQASTPTFGAAAGDVFSTVMGVDERPSSNNIVQRLESYNRLVSDGQGESKKAEPLRRELEMLSPRDPALYRADIEIRRRKLLKSMAIPGEAHQGIGQAHPRSRRLSRLSRQGRELGRIPQPRGGGGLPRTRCGPPASSAWTLRVLRNRHHRARQTGRARRATERSAA